MFVDAIDSRRNAHDRVASVERVLPVAVRRSRVRDEERLELVPLLRVDQPDVAVLELLDRSSSTRSSGVIPTSRSPRPRSGASESSRTSRSPGRRRRSTTARPARASRRGPRARLVTVQVERVDREHGDRERLVASAALASQTRSASRSPSAISLRRHVDGDPAVPELGRPARSRGSAVATDVDRDAARRRRADHQLRRSRSACRGTRPTPARRRHTPSG